MAQFESMSPLSRTNLEMFILNESEDLGSRNIRLEYKTSDLQRRQRLGVF